MAQYNDPRQPNWGVPSRGQLNPNMTAANSQAAQPRTPNMGSPMVNSLQRAPQAPAPQAPSGQIKPAVGTFGPQSGLFQGIKKRSQTDFGKGGWQGAFNAAGSALNVKSPFGAALGIQRRAKGSGNDLSVQDANTVLQRQYQSQLGRQASPQELQDQLAGQGLKPGDRWVGNTGLQSVLSAIANSEEANNYRNAPQVAQPNEAPVNGNFQVIDTPMAAGLQVPSKTPAQSAYEEYVTEFGPDDPEQPLDFETFSTYFDQLPQMEEESPMAEAAGRRGWENLLLDTQGEMDTPMSFSGFNMDRAMQGGDPNSVKDAFARAVSTFDTDLRNMSKQEVGQVLASPAFHDLLASQGIQSRPIPGAYDQIEVFTKENGWEVRDIVANAGSPEAQWWWGDVTGEDPGFGPTGLGPVEDTEGEEPQSALLNGLTGGSNWKTLLDQLLSQYGG